MQSRRTTSNRSAAPARRGQVGTGKSLRKFVAEAGRLTREERKVILRQALVLLEQNYVHLPMKRAMYSVDPIQRVKLLLRRVESRDEPEELEFHRELLDALYSVRDVHTRYLLPEPYRNHIAFLPFRVEQCWKGKRRQYIVSNVSEDFATFERGVEVVHWNGVPMERAVASHADRLPGSNDEARHARGLLTLTERHLAVAPVPDEEWVTVGYKTLRGEPAERRFVWHVITDPSRPSAAASRSAEASGVDMEVHAARRMHLEQFAPQKARTAAHERARGRARANFEDILTGEPIKTSFGTFGYVRIWSFEHYDVDAFVAEFIRLITTLPQDGLILDIRDNGGGRMRNAERILQTLTHRRIEPEPLQFINSPLNLEICRSPRPSPDSPDLEPWIRPIEEGLQTGAVYSAAFPQVADPEQYNGLGQKYFGPVVLITSALSYSASDMFAAGFQDHQIGKVIGTHTRTGGGGANMWEHKRFRSYRLRGAVYESLPNGADLRVAIRRSLRVGAQAGAVLEDFGVRVDEFHAMTQQDVLERNRDLIDHAASLLRGQPARSLKVTVKAAAGSQLRVLVNARGMTRLDLYVDERPVDSVDVHDGRATFRLDSPRRTRRVLEIRGFDKREPVARYREAI